MRNATKNTVAAALAVALAGMGLPAAALAANAADEAAGTAVAAAAADEDVIDFDKVPGFNDWMECASLAEVNGKWFKKPVSYEDEDENEPAAIRYMIKLNDDGDLDFYVDGTGPAGADFPVPDCCEEYAEAHGENGTLYVGAGITSIGNNETFEYLRGIKTVHFAEGSQLKTVGAFSFTFGVESANLENCTQLYEIGAYAFSKLKRAIIPASVRHIWPCALENVEDLTVLDPANTVFHPSALGNYDGSYVLKRYFPNTKAKAVGSQKLRVSWDVPEYVEYSTKTGKTERKAYSGKLYYKLDYYVEGRLFTESTGYTTKRSVVLPKLLKGKKYSVQLTLYKKNAAGKYKSVFTGYLTSPTIK